MFRCKYIVRLLGLVICIPVQLFRQFPTLQIVFETMPVRKKAISKGDPKNADNLIYKNVY
jgi:hypothetical protein